MKRIITYILVLTGTLSFGKGGNNIAGCAEGCIPNITINVSDTALHLLNGVYYYNGTPYYGFINSYYDTNTPEQRSGYLNGKLGGVQYTYFPNGRLQSERHYVKGEKDGTHFGWYDDGTRRFEYNFSNGMTVGLNTDWYPDGKVWRKAQYENGNELSVQAWRTNGKLYANYEVKSGVIYGMNNSNLCYTLKNERGNYENKK